MPSPCTVIQPKLATLPPPPPNYPDMLTIITGIAKSNTGALRVSWLTPKRKRTVSPRNFGVPTPIPSNGTAVVVNAPDLEQVRLGKTRLS